MNEQTEEKSENQIVIFSPSSIASNVEAETARRQVLENYIAKNLKKDVDYGVIPGSRSGKKCLLKPGAEKFCSLLQLRAEFHPDLESLSMLGEEKGVVAYLCRLIHIASGHRVSEGRGACSLAERQGNYNTTVKIAEKRAQIDAVLRLGLSDSFTQDLEDVPPAVMGVASSSPSIRPPIGLTSPRPLDAEPKKKYQPVKFAECVSCGTGITRAVSKFSLDRYGQNLCFVCQAKKTNVPQGDTPKVAWPQGTSDNDAPPIDDGPF